MREMNRGLAVFSLTLAWFLAGFVGCGAETVTANAVTEVEVRPQIAYRAEGEVSGPDCQLDLYIPKSSSRPFPLVIWVHGGGLTGGDKAEPPSVAVCRMLAQNGIGVASVNYRRNPKVQFPTYIEDVAAAVAWVEANAKKYGGNSERIYLSGHSAGAYLVTMLTMNPKYLEKAGFNMSHLVGVIPISGQVTTHFTIKKERGIDANTVISDAAAPTYFVRKQVPDMLLILGDRDWAARLEENAYFAACLKAAGAQNVTLRVIADRDHGTIFGKLSEPNDPGGNLILQFIREREARAGVSSGT
ncbi:MAG: hypothetical protein B9S32_05825 [Verrucomicrobia bacterium Tous-C9LFEB]|nr:MAG: hypothetical protein B9S32_05825 [Verrucomicrobia bacterium Tous-C9LFEB]